MREETEKADTTSRHLCTKIPYDQAAQVYEFRIESYVMADVVWGVWGRPFHHYDTLVLGRITNCPWCGERL